MTNDNNKQVAVDLDSQKAREIGGEVSGQPTGDVQPPQDRLSDGTNDFKSGNQERNSAQSKAGTDDTKGS